jgi:hypothetical protein
VVDGGTDVTREEIQRFTDLRIGSRFFQRYWRYGFVPRVASDDSRAWPTDNRDKTSAAGQ